MTNPNEFSSCFRFNGVDLRPATEKDIERLVEVINEAYSYQDGAKGEPRTSIDKLIQRMSEVAFYVAHNERGIVGCVYVEQKPPSLHFGLLTVIPSYRGKGLAAEIINTIERYAKVGRFSAVELDYMSLAPWLKSYYERYGYHETGWVEPWGSIDLVRMKKRI